MKYKVRISTFLMSIMLVMTSCDGMITNTKEESKYSTEEVTTESEEESTEEVTTESEEESTEEVTTESEEESTEEVTTESEEESTEEVIIENEKENIDFLTFSIKHNKLSEWQEDIPLCQISWKSLILDEYDINRFPQLALAIEDINIQYTALAHDTMEWLLPEAKLEVENNDYFYGYTSDSQYYIQRADEYIVSILRTYDEYTGGVHPNYGVSSVNINTITGELLGVDAVITDFEGLPELLTKKLLEKYEDYFWEYEDLLEMLQEYESHDFTWTSTYEDITFYFSPYEIASYAAGLLKITIPFDEIPNFVHKKYTQMPKEGYAIQLPLFEEVEIYLNPNDNKKDILCISSIWNEDKTLSFAARLNDQEYSDESYYAQEIIPYLVYVTDDTVGKYFLYVEAKTTEFDESNLFVYDLNEGTIEPIDILFGKGFHTNVVPGNLAGSYNYYYEVWNNPSKLILDDRLYVIGTGMGYKSFRVNFTDGKVCENNDYYTMYDDTPWTRSKIDLEVLILSNGTKEIITKGTAFLLLRTNGESYMDMLLKDGRECRIFMDNSNWPTTIQGIPELDCFEEMMNSVG